MYRLLIPLVLGLLFAGPIKSASADDMIASGFPKLPRNGVIIINNNTSAPELTQAYSEQVIARGYGASVIFNLVGPAQTVSEEEQARNRTQAALTQMQEKMDAVDLFVFSHRNNLYDFTARHLPPGLLKKIRLVYNAGCHDANEFNHWLSLGAAAYVGHIGSSESWLFITAFQSAWKQGKSVVAATDLGNSATREHVEGLEGKLLKELGILDIGKNEDIIEETRARAFGKVNLTSHARYQGKMGTPGKAYEPRRSN